MYVVSVIPATSRERVSTGMGLDNVLNGLCQAEAFNSGMIILPDL